MGVGFFRNLEVFVTKQSEYLSYNILTARCKIWRCDVNVGVDKYFLAETRVAIQRRSFHWDIEKFSTIGYNDTKHLGITSITNEVLMTVDLCLTGGQLDEEKIEIGIHIFDPNAKYVTFKTFVSDYDGQFSNCEMKEFVWEGCEIKGTLTLLLSKKQLQSTEPGMAKYLKNDVLTLYCECVFSTGIASETIESVDSEVISLKSDSQTVQKERRLPTDEQERVWLFFPPMMHLV
ncbi:speckle-type POZ protein B [Trichonephila clavipes]|nr:speckle-type POZ protein B [Trichonephila clavipes]